MEFITQNITIIVLAIIGLFAGIAITVRSVRNSKKNSDNDSSSNTVNQKNNRVGGDQAGRDIRK
jgi:F0F1-type ATP synthase assembly protein I